MAQDEASGEYLLLANMLISRNRGIAEKRLCETA